jgi:hypothetical protein
MNFASLIRYNEFHIVAERGDTLGPNNATFQIKDASGAGVDLSGLPGRMDLLRGYGETPTLIFDTSNGRLALQNGGFYLNANASTMEIPAGVYLYSLKVDNTGEFLTVAKGQFILRNNIT